MELTELAALTPRSAIAAIPPPEVGLEETKKVSVALIDSYNALLPQLAKEARALFIPLPAMPERHTLDGIHLNAAEVWDKAMGRGLGQGHVAGDRGCALQIHLKITSICIVRPPE